MTVKFFAKKVVPFTGTHFRDAAKVAALQHKLENADAQRLKTSIAALINNKTPTPNKPSLGLFAVVPKPPAPTLGNNRSIFKIK